MYQLYYSPGACSMAVHVVLNELNQPVEAIKVSIGDPANVDPVLNKVNPRNQVPVLVDNGQIMTEGAAMIVYLCDKHKSELIPASGIERAKALQWVLFGNSSLHVGYSRTAFIKRNGGSDEMVEKSRAMVQSLWDLIENHLEKTGQPYLAGASVTAGDILVSVIGNWSFTGAYNFGPKTKALFKAVSSRPAYQKAIEAEGIEYKAAA
jgi:glutathione S-transferase